MADSNLITLPGGIPGVEVEEGYAVTLTASVWTRWWRGASKRTGPTQTWRQMHPTKHPNGYLFVGFSGSNPPARRVYVHRLVALAFIGPCPAGTQVCHNNGDPSDNRVENLRYDTAKGNAADKLLHGTQPIGATHHNAKITEATVVRILDLTRQGIGSNAVARLTGATRQTVGHIKTGRTWSHFTGITTHVG